MEYINQNVEEIDIEEIEKALESGEYTIDEILMTWEKHEDLYQYWWEACGEEYVEKWLDDHGDPELPEEYVECMVYTIRGFVKWIKELN